MRLQLREQQAKAGDIVLLYGDESEALTHPYLARAWAKSGADLRVPAPGQAKKVAMLGSLNHVTHELIVHTSPTKRSSDFVAHLEQIEALYGPMPGRVSKPVVLVEDNGPIHVSKMSRAALAARAHWLTVEWLPKYTPELNDIEVVWHDLKAYNLAHQTFTGVADLDGAIHKAVDDLNRERMAVPLAKPRVLCLDLHQQLLRFGQRQTQGPDVTKIIRPADRHQFARTVLQVWERKMAQFITTAGIDVSKAGLDIALWPDETVTLHLDRGQAGCFDTLAAWLTERAVKRIGLEASGGYEIEVIHG